MEEKKVYLVPNVTGPTEAVTIDPDICVGCNACADICRVQTIMRNPVPGQPPIVAYPDECWYCSCCLEVCRTGALHMNFPINQRILFKRKETGEIFRLGEDGLEKTYFHTPYGDMTRDIPERACEACEKVGQKGGQKDE
ncbi:MAG: 4Fe-4S dicluster domain-containing protein [Lachnospiraceae bacterium]|nr:4Fe-4S dicluster domain-containing protein [Lachnospiraceae bacterium]